MTNIRQNRTSRFLPFFLFLHGAVLGIAVFHSPGSEQVGKSATAFESTQVIPESEESLLSVVQDSDGDVLASNTMLMPDPVTSFGAATHQGWVYTAGGYFGPTHKYSREGQSDGFRRARVGSNHWEQLPSIAKLQSLALISHGDALYRIGGLQARNSAQEPERLWSVSGVYRYDIESNRWHETTSLPEPRSSHDTIVVNGSLYVMGGWKMSGSKGDFEWPDIGWRASLPTPDQSSETTQGLEWESFSVPFRRRALALAASHGKIVAVGGMDDRHQMSPRTDIYDPETQQWTQGPDFPGQPFGLAAVSYEESVYANGADGKVYRWAVGDSTWEEQSSLAFPRYFHRLVVAGVSDDKSRTRTKHSKSEHLLAIGGIQGRANAARVRPIERISIANKNAGPVVQHWKLRAPSAAKNRQALLVDGSNLMLFGGNKSLEQHDFSPDAFVDDAHRLHLASLSWESMPSLPVRRQTMQSTLLPSATGLLLGGFGHDRQVARSFADGYRYDFKDERWAKEKISLPSPRSQFGLAHHNDKVWIFGGLDYDPRRAKEKAFQHPTDILVADVSGNDGATELHFQSIDTPMNSPRRAFAADTLHGRYFVVGGMQENFGLVQSCEAFNFAEQSWTDFACPPAASKSSSGDQQGEYQGRLSGELVALNDRLYLLGGSEVVDGELLPVSRILVYDPSLDSWEQLDQKLPLNPVHIQARAFENRLLLYSAQNTDSVVDVVLMGPFF